jgi:hypothetical protein
MKDTDEFKFEEDEGRGRGGVSETAMIVQASNQKMQTARSLTEYPGCRESDRNGRTCNMFLRIS